jgi:SAM-dependent methyltransferase
MEADTERNQFLTKHIRKEAQGIEISPWFRPLAPRSEGHNSSCLDIFDRDTLIQNCHAVNVGYMADRIGEVAFVGSAVDIQAIVEAARPGEKFDYVLSSHNLEHLPNPVKFLQGCGAILAPSGHLSMAVPDKRFCFDYFRPVSTTSEFLAAWFENRTRPSFAQIFEQRSMESLYVEDGALKYGFAPEKDPSKVYPGERVEEVFADWKRSIENASKKYEYTHCWVLTPASFELIIRDLAFLEMINFNILEISKTSGMEFIAHLERIEEGTHDDPRFYGYRRGLLNRVLDECAANAPSIWAARHALRGIE